MKKFTFLLVLLPLATFAQKAEVGVTGGFAANSATTGTIYYTADKSVGSFGASATFLSNLPDKHFQLGADIYGLGLANKASKALATPYFGKILGANNETFTYAKLAVSFCPIVNYKVNLNEQGYIYGGLAIGIAASYAQPQTASNSDGSAITFRGINGGFGFTGGGQLGISYAVTPRIALNGELALRYYHLGYTTSTSFPNGPNVYLNTFAYPITFGIRYRIGFEKQLNYETGRYEIMKNKDKKSKAHSEK